MSEKQLPTPFHILGGQLKRYRQKRKLSMAEVSGAVEIDIETLARIEQGAIRPAEDILLLLISHFGIGEEDANKLWELAGYNRQKENREQATDDDSGQSRSFVMLMPIETRIVYTDSLQVHVGNDAIVLNFMQNDILTNQSVPIARVGMSKQNAISMLELLKKTLSQKALPAPDKQNDKPAQG